jgi:hypothetical protein
MALAGGDYLFRTPLTTNFGQCKAGQLNERVLSGANVSGLWQEVAVACMQDMTHAEWIVLSGLNCGNSSSDQVTIGKCIAEDNRKVPLLFSNRPPAPEADNKISYSFLRYAAGKDCVIAPAKSAESDPAWKCNRTIYFDGTRNRAGQPITDPGRMMVRHFFTTGDTPLVPEDDNHKNTSPIPVYLDGSGGREVLDETGFIN